MTRDSLLFLSEGDPNTGASWSGISQNLVRGLRGVGYEVTGVDCDLAGPSRVAAAALSWHPERDRWWVRYHLGGAGFRLRSRRASLAVARHPDAIVLQVGATFLPSLRKETPFVIFTDGNIELARQAAPVAASDARHLTAMDIARIREREARVYARADLVLTLSDRVAESVVSDFSVPSDRVLPMYAGPNLALDSVPDVGGVEAGIAPTVLFVGRQFERKGGDLLLAAFSKVRARMPEARLVLIGPRSLPTVPPGVEFLGLIDKSTADGWARLVKAYADASVFCLPSRYEGFPISVLEAMLFARPCVVLRFPWMRAEMVEDGVTGFAISGEDTDVLAARLLELLGDPSTASRMGAAGRRRVLERYTWPHTIDRIREGLSYLRGAGVRSR